MSHLSGISRAFVTGLKILVLTGVMVVLFSTVYTVVGVADDPSLAVEASETEDAVPAEQSRVAMILVGVCFLQTLALSVAILRSRWTGWKLILAIFTVIVLGTAVLSHIDSLYFLQDMSRALIAKLALASTLLAVAFSTVAVWVLGRAHGGETNQPPSDLEHHSMSQWAMIVLALAVLHIVFYFVFGYYVAWKSPELRAFYGGEDPGSFWLQMANVVKDTPWLIPIQVLRGILWGLLAVLLANGLTGPRSSAALITAALFVTLFALPLVIPNPFMPDAVRQTHLIETILSRGLYGFVAVWFLWSPLQPHWSKIIGRGSNLIGARVM